ncbi:MULTISPECIES: M23 family metallopeptidase [unclassified Chelatococcus]|uniref:M23 family metallopeptidase n=1 Tax=unclassified Chelatococcus TaxID=2638111 RepID=UPI001BCF7F08|nr:MULTISPECIES: M23 family metallopeptidase [unclassified Chelatococcus]MBS7695997.1 M23 family metallopeptidase [Chelatococcus sp. YT9]MBX3557979.1 M23 family metallopeptidase [Chelatococcus sp.]
MNLRWLVGSVLTGFSGAALLGAAIYIALQGETSFAAMPQTVGAQAIRPASGDAANEIRRGDKLVRTQSYIAAKQSFKAPMTIRVADREVIKVRSFVRLATNLSLTSGAYATDIPAFNPQKLFAEDGPGDEQVAEPAPETTDADVSLVKSDLSGVRVADGAPHLSDDEAIVQVEEDVRAAEEAGSRPALPMPAQLMLTRALGQAGPSMGALAYASPTDTPFSGLDVRVIPENVTIAPKVDPMKPASGPRTEERLIVMKRDETLEQILRANGAAPDTIKAIIAALGTDKARALGEGQQIKLLLAPLTAEDKKATVVRVTLLDERTTQAIVAVNDQGRYVPVDIPQEAVASAEPTEDGEEDGEEDNGSGTRLYESLYETALKNEIPASVVAELVRVFASDVDFQHRVDPGNSVEIFYGEGEDSDAQRPEILYASLTIGGETKRIYRFQSPEDNSIEYLDEEGRSLKKFLIRKPISSGIMRSGFGMRYHPILHYSKMHTGVDWADKIGTPILAAGDGVILKAGWSSGYGRRIEIQHSNGYVTTYNHQSAFARGIKPGMRVRQGQVIGYLGATGLATGPHLHYEVMVNGHFVNPLKIKLPRSRELDGSLLAEFRRQRDQTRELLTKASPAGKLAQAGQ